MSLVAFVISIDPNKDGQSTFNSFPELELYHPWGRPGAGAPLIHAPTGQKYTRYSGSLQDKLVFSITIFVDITYTFPHSSSIALVRLVIIKISTYTILKIKNAILN